jgi:dienelactone hydrolase
MIRSSLLYLATLSALFSLPSHVHAQDGRLPNTRAFPWNEEDISGHLMDGAHQFVNREINQAIQKREQAVNSSKASLSALRQRLRHLIGLGDKRVEPIAFEKFGTGAQPGLVVETQDFRIWQVRWSVLPLYSAEGLLVEPIHVKSNKSWIALPDADETPEQVLGIGTAAPTHHQHLFQMARAGVTVLVPASINRQEYIVAKGNEPAKPIGQSHREWLHRQAFHMGRHVLGYEVQAVLAATDIWLKSAPNQKVFCSGYGEGGLVALLASASDERLQGNLIAGYLGQEIPSWEQPLFRNIQSFERDLGVAGLIRLQQGRPLLIHAVNGPEYADSKGKLVAQVNRVALDSLLQSLSPEARGHCKVIDSPQVTAEDLALFIGLTSQAEPQVLQDQRTAFSSSDRHRRVFKGIENHVQQLIRDADALRDENYAYTAEPGLRRGSWSTLRSHPTLNPSSFISKSKFYRETYAGEAMGQFDAELLPLNPRSRKILENDQWTAWDVVLDVHQDLTAWGVLILPKDLKEGEKRPAVVVQHGRNGLPRDWIDFDKTAYSHAGTELAERGFIVFAPHNIYRGEDRYRQLNKKANAIGATLYSYIIPSHRQILTWLKSLPQLDPQRIAFYGLSYGGESAMRIPAVLEDYCAVICSGDFNQWTRKVAATDYPNSFMYSIEWEMPYWNLGQTFDYAEMAYLIFPRPFMVERGHHDLVASDPWVAYEYAKVRYLYDQFGMADRTEIEFFQGGHSINDQNTFRFLHRHLDWAEPRPSAAKSR